MSAEKDRSRPGEKAAWNVTDGDKSSVPSHSCLADIDAQAELLRGVFVLRVQVNDDGDRRTYFYKSAGAAERAVKRARERGRTAHVALCQLVPVGVVWGPGGLR